MIVLTLHFIFHHAYTNVRLGKCVLLTSTLALLLLAGCVFFGMRWAGSDVGKNASDIDTFNKTVSNREGEHNLPWFPPPFIGRDENVSHITNMLLRDPRICGVHITGAPAIGKSHLAVHVGYELVRHGVNIRYIDVSETQLLHVHPKESVQKSSSYVNENNQNSTALDKKRTSLMLSWFSPQENCDISVSASTLLSWARNVKTDTTIILDNCDDVLQGALRGTFLDMVQKLQKVSKYIKFISTSRVKFTLIGVKHFPLEPLKENSSIDLLQHECERLEVEEMKAVANLVGHNPLGLRLAANLACDVIAVKELIKSLKANSVKPLSSETIPDKQKMWFVINESIKYLEEEVVLCARNISLFPGSFSKEAALSILSGCGIEDATFCLNSLSHKSLLEWYAVRGESRYRYHHLVRDSFTDANFLKNTRHFSSKSDAKETFFEQYSAYFIMHLKKTLQECETGLSIYCEYWINDEEHNIAFVPEAIFHSSPRIAVTSLLWWGEILRSPTFWKFYGVAKVSRLIYHEMKSMLHLFYKRKAWDYRLDAVLHELTKLLTEWDMYMVFVALISSLLVPPFKKLLQTHSKRALSWSNVGIFILAYTTSLLASTTPASCATWLLQFFISYVPLLDGTCTVFFVVSVVGMLLMICVLWGMRKKVALLFRCFFILYLVSIYYDINIIYPHAASLHLFLLPLTLSMSCLVSTISNVLFEFCFVISLLFVNCYYIIRPPALMILLVKVIFVLRLWFVYNRSSLPRKQDILLIILDILLIILVLCGDSHFLSQNHILFAVF